MISISWDSYGGNQDEDGTQVHQNVICSWQEFDQGWGTFANGKRFFLPVIGTIYDYYQDPFLAVTNVSWEPDSGFMPDINKFYPNDAMMIRVTYTYSSDNAVRARIRANQASSWSFKWDVELVEITPAGYLEYNLPVDPQDPEVDLDPTLFPRDEGDFVEWATQWKAANPGHDDLEDSDVPELTKKEPYAQLIFTCYSDDDRGFTFANEYLGRINRSGWSQRLIQRYQESINKHKERYKTVAEYKNAMANAEDVDQYKWLFTDYEVNEIRPKVFQNVLYFDYNPNTWDYQQNSYVPMYQTAEFNNITIGMDKSEPYEEKNP